MIIIALGSNLPSEKGDSRKTLEAALERMADFGLSVVEVSSWYETEPVPKSDQPNFINGVAVIEAQNSAESVLEILHEIEEEFGRRRTVLNAARSLDLDLIDYNGVCISPNNAEGLVLPHPRMQDRGFVLYPLQEVAPNWCHPVSGASISQLIQSLPNDQKLAE